jgi:hypothetical protein
MNTKADANAVKLSATATGTAVLFPAGAPVWGVASGSTKADAKERQTAAAVSSSYQTNGNGRGCSPSRAASGSARARLGWGRPRITYKTPPQVETKNPQCGGDFS